MLWIRLGLLLGLCVWDSCSIKCPDGNICSDLETCCKTRDGYKCCPYPKAVCCLDMAHCCPTGYRCNLVTLMCEKENQPWMNIPMAEKEAAEDPRPPVLPGLPIQEHKNDKYSHVSATGMTEASSDALTSSVIRCDSRFYCQAGTSCCKGSTDQWNCCPYPLGNCCADGQHCCEYGYTCDPSFLTCRRFYSQVPAGAQQDAETD